MGMDEDAGGEDMVYGLRQTEPRGNDLWGLRCYV